MTEFKKALSQFAKECCVEATAITNEENFDIRFSDLHYRKMKKLSKAASRQIF